MKITLRILLLFLFIAVLSGLASAQKSGEILGIKLNAEELPIVREIETKTGKRLLAYFTDAPDFQFGSSYIDDKTGSPEIYIDAKLQSNPKKMEAVIVHELLHLRLRANGYPTFLFSPDVRTAQGRAIDVEQGHANDLLSLIEHRLFKPDMIRLGLYQVIDLAGDTASDARRRKGGLDGQADAINYARAILEYHNQRDIDTVKQLFTANGWKISIREGESIASYIQSAVINEPKDIEPLFRLCLQTILPLPASAAFIFTPDLNIKTHRQMVIKLQRKNRVRR